jgi:pimeloyl-ACP methyl ester carboxylesterase
MITRHYVDVGGRLVHYRRTGSGKPVVLLHESPRSSVALLPLIERLPPGLTVFALDTPGYGQSDAPPYATPELRDYAGTVRATMAALGIARAPIYGTHTGAAIAFAVAAGHPEQCALAVLDGFPVFSPLEREEALASYLPPFRPAVDGTHLAWLWSRVRDQTLFFPWYRRGEAARLHLPLPPPEALQIIAMDILRAGDNYRIAYATAFASRPLEQIGGLAAPVLFGARMDDVLLGHLDRLPAQMQAGLCVERFPADRDAWGQTIWARMAAAAAGAAPEPSQASLPAARVGRAYVEAAGITLHVRGATGGRGRPLLLLHPLPGGSAWFAGRLERLAGVRPVLAPDLPGAGESDPLGDATPEATLDALEAMLASLDVTEVEISGEGTGALLARALHLRDPRRRSLGALDDLPVAGAIPPDFGAFTPHPTGAHLFAAWLHVRDEAILGPWTSRAPRPFDALDAQFLHCRTVDVLKARADQCGLVSRLLAAG